MNSNFYNAAKLMFYNIVTKINNLLARLLFAALFLLHNFQYFHIYIFVIIIDITAFTFTSHGLPH